MAMRKFRRAAGIPIWLGLALLAGVAGSDRAAAFVKFAPVASKWGPDPTHGTSGGVVTWGFVPDGTPIDPDAPTVVPAVTGGSNISQLRNRIDNTLGHGTGAFNAEINRAFETWAAVANITFVGPIGDPGDPIASTSATSPDIRIGAFVPVDGHWFSSFAGSAVGPPGFVTPEFQFPESG